MADQSDVVELLTAILDELKDINFKLDNIDTNVSSIDTTLLLKS